MHKVNRFEIISDEKEMIKTRLMFTVSYYGDRVLIRETYIDQVLNEYREKKDEDIRETTLITIQLLEIDYRMLLMYLCMISQMFEQFLIDIIVRNLNLEKGIRFTDVIKKFQEYGFVFEEISSWEKIVELRLLVNVIKHADGQSKDKLQKIREDYFYDKNKMINNAINDMKLNIRAKDFFEYATAIVNFINDMPTCYEKKE